jgi:hypothetical protein
MQSRPTIAARTCAKALCRGPMSDEQKLADIETLAKMAARLAGRDPDQHLKLELGDFVAFDDPIWRYPDFLSRAETAYKVLESTI